MERRVISGTSETKVFDERSPSGNDYLSEVCREWEARALEVDKDVRLVLIRIGVVLGKDSGALGIITPPSKMIPLFMMFAGGPIGSGKQWFSWIHLDDLVNLIYEALSNPSYEGQCNSFRDTENPVNFFERNPVLGAAPVIEKDLPVCKAAAA
ncbi:Complement component 1 Q subcomponent-binding protein, mitochondrial [Asimina triloba]